MEVCIDEPNKSFLNLDNNLAYLENLFEIKYVEVYKLRSDPKNPDYISAKNELRCINNKLRFIVRS